MFQFNFNYVTSITKKYFHVRKTRIFGILTLVGLGHGLPLAVGSRPEGVGSNPIVKLLPSMDCKVGEFYTEKILTMSDTDCNNGLF